jgi:hypothetical protein
MGQYGLGWGEQTCDQLLQELIPQADLHRLTRESATNESIQSTTVTNLQFAISEINQS